MRAHTRVLASLGTAAIIGASLPLAAPPTPVLASDPVEEAASADGETADDPYDPQDSGEDDPTDPTGYQSTVNGGATCCTY